VNNNHPTNTNGANGLAENNGQACATYRIFDIAISSQIPLPELTAYPEEEPLITIRRAKPGQIDSAEFASNHEWRDDGDRLISRSGRRGNEYLLSFPQQASFHIKPGAVIDCIPSPGAAEGLVRHLLLNQILPRYLGQTGKLLLHGSAVTLPNGKTVGFLGDSGHGKSTLAVYCQRQGAQLIDDDCVLVHFEDHGACITGGAPTIRLYPDSVQSLSHNPDHFVPYVDYTEKLQMRLTDTSTPKGGKYALDALFQLCSPKETPACNPVRIEPAPGQAAVMAIVRSALTLDPTHRDTMRGTFQHAENILAAGVPLYNLHYPREHAQLPQVYKALLQHRFSSLHG
jgi:hypothetical protein